MKRCQRVAYSEFLLLLFTTLLFTSSGRSGWAADAGENAGEKWDVKVEQITSGPKHHFFGYIGHVRTIPWNASGRYIVALRSEFQDRMPTPKDAADVVLLDTKNRFEPRVVTQTNAWNFQQGTMLYWNPDSAETQFFFNDRDPVTQEVFCALFDISRGEKGERIAEYRFPGVSIGNGGVAQTGGWFLGINYGRLARLRPVTGYPQAHDATDGQVHPENDGVFKVNVKSRERQLLVSYKQLAEILRPRFPDIDRKPLFINHTMWSRNDKRIYFFARGDFENRDSKVRLDVPFTMAADGTDLRPLGYHIGGHVEWLSDTQLIGAMNGRQVIYDIEQSKVVDYIGDVKNIPTPGGDVALSFDGKWFVNGGSKSGDRPQNEYTIVRLADGAWKRAGGLDRGRYTKGELRIDPAPCWNRDGSQLLAGGLAPDGTRQIFVITLKKENL